MTSPPQDFDNQVRWRPGCRRGHVESYFLKANAVDGTAFWLKFTIFSPTGGLGQTVAEAWAIVFDAAQARHVAVKQTWPMDAVDIGFRLLFLKFGPCSLVSGQTHGALQRGLHEVRWNLTLTSASKPLRPFPYEWMYRGPFPSTKIVTPNPDARVSGEIWVDGRSLRVDRWHGMQGHNWGRRHSERYAWVHCNAFDGDPPDTFFEGFSGQVRIGPLLTPLFTLMALQYRGERIAFVTPRYWLNRNVRMGHYFWCFSAQDERYRLQGEFRAPAHDMVGLHYANPQGPGVDCLNSKIATGRLQLTPLCGGSSIELRASRQAALEIVSPQPHPDIALSL